MQGSEEATTEVGQYYVLCTFDLGGCMKALPVIWQDPNNYRRHVIIPGAFHTMMNFIGMLTGHKCKGSGYAEILIEAELVTSGCLGSVLSGKAFSKALFCLKTVSEALESMLFEKFLEDEGVELTNPITFLNLVQYVSRENLEDSMHDASVDLIIEQYSAYEQKVRDGVSHNTKTV